MNKILMFFLAFMIIPLSSYAQDQNILIEWQMEDGTGSVVTDLQGPIISNGFLSNGANFETNNVAFGTYDVDFDGGNDVIQASVSNPAFGLTPGNKFDSSVSFWFRPDDGDASTLFTIYGFQGNSLFEFQYDTNTEGNREFIYLDNTGSEQTIEIGTAGVPGSSNGVYNHVALNVDATNSEVTVFFNNVAYGPFPMTDLADYEDSYIIRLGTNNVLGGDYNGDIDAFYLMDFLLNTSQVNELFTTNTVTLHKDPVNEVDDVQESDDIIVSMNPSNGQSLVNPVEFSLTLNTPSSCDLYLDNNYYMTYDNTIGFTETRNFEEGNHSYYYLCHYIQNNTEFFQISNTSTFEVSGNLQNQVTFQIVGSDFDVNSIPLQIMSPCPEMGVQSRIVDIVPYGPEYNPNGIVIESLVNGIATFDLDVGVNEFCLHNGRVIVSGEGKTTDYDVVTSDGIVNLGKLNIPNNVSSNFLIEVESFDVYDKLDPKAWGQTWPGIISTVLLAIVGILMMIAGVTAGNGQIALIGGLILLGGFGIQFNGILGVLF